MVSDDDRKFWGLSERNHTPDAPPIWTLSSPRFRPLGRQVDIPLTPQREAIITHSSPASRDRVPELAPPRIVDLPLPVLPRITLPRFSLSPSGIHKVLERRFASSGPGNDQSNAQVGSASPCVDAQPSQTTQLYSLLLSIPAHLEDCGKSTAVLRSRHEGINSEAGTSSSRTALGSLPSGSGLGGSVDRGTSMRARRRRRDPVPQSSLVTSVRSKLAPDDFPITTSRSSGLLLSQISNLPDASLSRQGAKTQDVKRITKSMPRPMPSRLVTELVDQAFIQSGPDCFLPGDSGERVRLRIIAAFADLDLGSL